MGERARLDIAGESEGRKRGVFGCGGAASGAFGVAGGRRVARGGILIIRVISVAAAGESEGVGADEGAWDDPLDASLKSSSIVDGDVLDPDARCLPFSLALAMRDSCCLMRNDNTYSFDKMRRSPLPVAALFGMRLHFCFFLLQPSQGPIGSGTHSSLAYSHLSHCYPV
jgi:hypothetical protein